jgi:GNAT superfamily N-acetyltransferase
MDRVRQCREQERHELLAIINAAAEAYRGVIPGDRWHEPYMTAEEIDQELRAGVRFSGYEAAGRLVGVMGIQRVRQVKLIRHAYVLPGAQRRGVGAALLKTLRRSSSGQLLVGTWAAAGWAIRFYEKHGFRLVAPARSAVLLDAYWDIPARQIETSVVLANPPLD